MKKYVHIFRPLYIPIVNFLYQKFKAPKRYHHLFDEIARLQATRILEVGTWNGGRAVKMIKTAQKVSPVKDILYVGFDLFEELDNDMFEYEISKRPPQKKEVEEKLSKTGAHIELVQGNTLETLPAYVKNAEPFDFIFIDGGHNVNTVRSDWNAVRQLMDKDTVIIFDDYWRNRDDQSAKPVVDAIDRTKYNIQILNEIDVFDNVDHGRLEISFAKVTRRF
ncbi:MAG: class I SAM-dependent methyltransferase [Patescibacteria group bacterium UBA2163]